MQKSIGRLLVALASVLPGAASATLIISVDTTVTGSSTYVANGSGSVNGTYNPFSSAVSFNSTLTATGPFNVSGPTLSSCPGCSTPYDQTNASAYWGTAMTPTTPFTASLLAYDTYAGSMYSGTNAGANQYFFDYSNSIYADFSGVTLNLYSYFSGGDCSPSSLANGNTRYDCSGFSYYRQWFASQSNPSFITSPGDVAAWTEAQYIDWLNGLGTMQFSESGRDYEYYYECDSGQCGSVYYTRYSGANVSGNARISAASVSEPATLALLGLGFAGLAASRRRKQ